MNCSLRFCISAESLCGVRLTITCDTNIREDVLCVESSVTILQGVSKKFGEWYQKTTKKQDSNKLNLLTFKIIAILHNTLLAAFINLLETASKGLFRNRSQNRCHTFLSACAPHTGNTSSAYPNLHG